MLTRRRFVTVLLIATPFLPFIAWFVWWSVFSPFPVRAYERLRLGMTPMEVEKAIGVPPGRYDEWEPPRGGITSGQFGIDLRESGLPRASLPHSFPEWRDSDLTIERWVWDDFWIWVVFDKDEKVVGFYLLKSSGPTHSPSLLDRLRQFIGL